MEHPPIVYEYHTKLTKMVVGRLSPCYQDLQLVLELAFVHKLDLQDLELVVHKVAVLVEHKQVLVEHNLVVVVLALLVLDQVTY